MPIGLNFSGFLWGSAALSRTCEVLQSSQEALDFPEQPTQAPTYSDVWVLVIALRIAEGYRAMCQ
jgi:hypothetical protein